MDINVVSFFEVIISSITPLCSYALTLLDVNLQLTSGGPGGDTADL